MKQPVYWKGPPEVSESEEPTAEDSAPGNFSGFSISLIKIGGFLLVAVCCILLFLLNAVLSWWALLMLALPAYLFLEWLGEKVFADKYGWSTAQVGFSVTRIILGVSLVVAVFGVIFMLWRWAN